MIVRSIQWQFRKFIAGIIGIGPKNVKMFEDLYLSKKKSEIEYPENVNLVLKHEPGDIEFSPKIVTLDSQKFFIRDVKNWPRFQQKLLIKHPERKLFSVQNAAILGPSGIIYDRSTRTAIFESAVEWDDDLDTNRVFGSPKLKKVTKIEGVAYSICSIGADGGFYHFFHEVLPKLKLIEDYLSFIDYIIISGEACEWKLKWLKEIPLILPKILWLDGNGHLTFDQLLFCNQLVKDQHPSYWSISVLKKFFLNYNKLADILPTAIVWATRKDENKRVIAWEDDIGSKFPDIKFIDFSNLSVSETITLCRSSAIFIGPHGAAFSNLIFCHETTKVIEIFDSEQLLPLYGRLSYTLGLEHLAIQINFKGKNKNEDFETLEKSLNLTNSSSEY